MTHRTPNELDEYFNHPSDPLPQTDNPSVADNHPYQSPPGETAAMPRYVPASSEPERIGEFLMERGRPASEADDLVRRLRPMLGRLDHDGFFRPAPASEVLVALVADAIALATGREVARIRYGTFNTLIPLQSWLGEPARIGLSEKLIQDAVKPPLNTAVWNHLGAPSGTPAKQTHQSFEAMESCHPALRNSARFQKSLIGGVVHAAVWRAWNGDRAGLAKLFPLLDVLGKVLPVGELKTLPGEWLVLVA